jgi:rhodanese-related sulfurtransferase
MYLRTVLVLLLLNTALPSFSQEIINPKFEKKVNSLLGNTVSLISCERLQEKYSTDLYILDARERSEFKVSHLKNARFVGYDNFSLKSVSDIPKESKVVVYCSIGYRSEKVGEKLKAAGFRSVYNLYGGIFEWTNREFPLYEDQNTATKNIHPYNKEWGKWLSKGDKLLKAD